ncbi:MAG: rhomboid family intramembrane serine protease [Akkermansiaceae bacterium]
MPRSPVTHRLRKFFKALKDHLSILLIAVSIAWGLEILDTLFLGFFDRFGIQPRSLAGLPGVLTAPFLHLSFDHLASNTVSFLILGGIILIGGRKVFLRSSMFIILVGGITLWALGPSATNHIGASGLIFGYLGFLFARGIFGTSLFWVGVSILVLYLYWEMLRGIFPREPGISWQSHLFGFLAGILAARVFCKSR